MDSNLSSEWETLVDKFKNELRFKAPSHSFAEVYDYALFPPGKLFRPLLGLQVAKDFSGNKAIENSDLVKFLFAIECHHAYSLVHDDLPAMDDDDMRRGKPSTHKKFGEWKAILSGDGLLNLSLGLLFDLKSEERTLLGKVFSWSTGPKGLIQGQVLDLAEEGQKDFDQLLETHKLKTARLIQLSLLGPAILTEGPLNSKILKDMWRLGYSLGLLFQFLDDLTELVDEGISDHEKAINPWLNFQERTSKLVYKHLKNSKETMNSYELVNAKKMITDYLQKTQKKITDQQTNVEKHLGNQETLSSLLPFAF